jgi:hypothetical protein
MNTTVAGLLTGLALGFAGYFGGFGAFIVVAVLGLVGLIAGYLARGDVHVSDYLRTREDGGRRGRVEDRRSGFRPGPRTEPDRLRTREDDGRRRTAGDRRSGFGAGPRTEHRARVQ